MPQRESQGWSDVPLQPTDRSNILPMNATLRHLLATVTLLAVAAAPAPGQTPPPATQGQGQQGQGQGQAQQGQGQGRGGGRGGQQGQGGQGQGGGNRQPARDNAAQQPQATGTAALSGTVVSDGGRPVRRARVTLSGADLRSAKAATTDDLGAFAFTDLPAGRFTLSASKPGYVNSSYGQKKPGRPGTPIQLADSQKMTNLKMTLPKGGVLTGVVLDEHGDPTPGTQVTAWRYEMRTGEKRLAQAGADQTDDRGMYRIFGLLPGDYIVRATPRNNLNDLRQVVQDVAQALTAGGAGAAGGQGGGRGGQALGALGGGGLQQLLGGRGAGGGQAAQALQGLVAGLNGNQSEDAGMGYAPVYYPGTTTSSSASTITLGVSEERQALDFQLQLVTTATVSGTVTTPDGDAGGIMLTLVNETEQALGGSGINTTRAQPDGSFTFSNVAPGQYVLKARGGGGRGGRGGGGGRGGFGAQGAAGAQTGTAPAAPPEQLWGQVGLTVDGRSLSGVAVTMQPGMKVNGHITFDGGAAPADLTRVRIALAPAATGGANDLAQNAPAQLDATGHFSITGVTPGRYTVRVQGQVPGFTLRSAIIGARDALDFSLDVKPNEDIADIAVVMSTKTQELSGTLTDGQNQAATDYSVIIFATDAQYWLPQSRRIVSLRPGTDGRFTARNLPPGEYYMAAVTDVEPGEWFDPEFLQQLRAASVRVTLNDGDKKTQDLRIGG